MASVASTSKQKVARLAGWSIAVAFLVLGLKTLAWRMTGSVALYSDALESIVNVIAATAAWWAIQVSHRPADREEDTSRGLTSGEQRKRVVVLRRHDVSGIERGT